MLPPNLNTLRMFDAAARHLNFRLAADEVHLTQGAVAQQVRRLEADLGRKLFDRHARGLALTEAGRRYHGAVRRALAILEEATDALAPERAKAPRRVSLSVPPSVASKWLVPRLAAFAVAHPEIDLAVSASEALSDFRTDGVDIAIRQGRAPFPDIEMAELLAPLELCAVIGQEAATRLGLGAGMTLAKLVAHPLIQDSHDHWSDVLDAAGLASPPHVARFNQAALCMDAAAHGQGIALAPRLLADSDVAAGRLVVLWRDDRSDRGGFYLISPEPARPNPARDTVLAWLRIEADHRLGDTGATTDGSTA